METPQQPAGAVRELGGVPRAVCKHRATAVLCWSQAERRGGARGLPDAQARGWPVGRRQDASCRRAVDCLVQSVAQQVLARHMSRVNHTPYPT